MTKVNVAQMGAEAANELRETDWEAHTEWENRFKEQGNVKFKEERYEEAIDSYMRALCGMDFSSYEHLQDAKADKERELNVKRNLKAPVLNNIA